MTDRMVEVIITFEFNFHEEHFPEVFKLPEDKMKKALAGTARDLIDDGVVGEAAVMEMYWVNGDPGHWESAGPAMRTEI